MNPHLSIASFLVVLGAASTAHAEGSDQIGTGQRLVDDTLLEVDIERVGESIFLRGGSDVSTAVDVEITTPSGMVERGSLTPGRGWTTTTTGTSLCAAYPFVTREVGTHRVRFLLRESSIDPWLRTLTPYDVAVTRSACTDAPMQGRLHATRWHLRATDWSRDSSVNTTFFVLANRDIVALDLEGVAGFEFFIQAGPNGLNAPYERTSQQVRVSPMPTTRPDYPLYVRPPTIAGATRPDLGRLVSVAQTSETALIRLAAYETCSWEITLDRDHDGTFDVVRDAPVERGTGTFGEAELRISTLGLEGATRGRLRLETDEVHFAGYDIETARPGITFARWNTTTLRREPLSIHWDDRALALGEAHDNPSPIEALDGLSAVQHGWGTYTATSPGNDAWIDTWSAARTQSIEFELADPTRIDNDAGLDANGPDVGAVDASVVGADAHYVGSGDGMEDAGRRIGGLSGGANCSAGVNARSNHFTALIVAALVVLRRRRS